MPISACLSWQLNGTLSPALCLPLYLLVESRFPAKKVKYFLKQNGGLRRLYMAQACFRAVIAFLFKR